MVHRWAGLTTAIFLIVAGVTGMVMPFEEPLTFATRPSLSRAVPPGPAARVLDGITIATRVEKALDVDVAFVPLEIPASHVVRLFVAAKPARPPLPYDVVWADPYTGAVALTYRFGGVTDGPENIVPFLYSLHYGFVAGPWGVFVFGIAALIWTIDCFVGFYLTLPIRRRDGDRRGILPWWRRWHPAWRVRTSNSYKLNFDLHRAGGLWLWPLLLIFAWSAVGLALPQVEQPVMRLFGATTDYRPPARAAPLIDPPIAMRDAVAAGRAQLARLGRDRHFAVLAMSGVGYDAASGSYRIFARTSLDRADEGGRTAIWIDASDGRALHFDPPLGHSRADGLMQWLYMLHMAEVFGLAYRIFVSVVGGAVAVLAATGVIIWWRKRAARRRTGLRLSRRNA